MALARLLAREGHQVRLAGPGDAPAEALALAGEGVTVEPGADLDAEPGPADVAYLDVWTSEVAPRVRRLRSAGATLSCLSGLLLERWPGPTVGITGTAGKTTTASFAVQLLRAAGLDVAASTRARAANLWATEELLDDLADAAGTVLVLELTSSHLCFAHHSPDVAVVTAFWPDHLELHGTLDAYRGAKEAIVRHQAPGDRVVVNADDRASAAFAQLTPAERAWFSLTQPVDQGTFLEGGRVVARWGGAEREVGEAGELPVTGARQANVLAAVTVALAAGAPLDSLPGTLPGLEPPPYRARVVARTPGGAAIVDDGLAATPAKAAATMAAYPRRSLVLVAGGETALRGIRVHDSREERALLEAACDEAARAASVAVLFGGAGDELASLLGARGVEVRRAPSLDGALAAAVAESARGAAAVLFSPMYPVAQADRERFADLARREGRL